MGWQRLGEVAASRLGGARVQAHWAAQVLSAAGETFLAHVPDTSHTAMTWDPARAALVAGEIAGADPCRVALRVADLSLLLLGRDGGIAAEFGLAGRTLADAYAWTSASVKAHTRGAHGAALVHPGYELPPHALASGGRFERDAGLPELARWYADAALALTRFASGTSGAGPVLCWPHHFDIASLVVLERDSDGEPLRTVGVGFSPGDDFVAMPYWYVNHGPETPRRDLPPLASGGWFTDGWIGAVLRGGELVAAGDARAQQSRLEAFVASAFAASRALALEAPLEPQP
jgi:hypothetical protein